MSKVHQCSEANFSVVSSCFGNEVVFSFFLLLTYSTLAVYFSHSLSKAIFAAGIFMALLKDTGVCTK